MLEVFGLPTPHEYAATLLGRVVRPRQQLEAQEVPEYIIEAVYQEANNVCNDRWPVNLQQAEQSRNQLRCKFDGWPDEMKKDLMADEIDNLTFILLGVIGEIADMEMDVMIEHEMKELCPPESFRDRVAGAMAAGAEVGGNSGNVREALATFAGMMEGRVGGTRVR